MGCDIHFYVEKWDEYSKRWVSADKWVEEANEPEEESRMVRSWRDEIYGNRNYDTFAILANVRNGYGFAGCDTGDGFKPIAMPRGLPKDVSKFVKQEADRWNGDGHSYSWLTLEELKNYDWNQQSTKQRGWVNVAGYKEFKEKGKPSCYSGGISGPTIKHVSNADMEKAIELGDDKDTYTQVEWGETYAEAASDFVQNVIPKLEMIRDNKHIPTGENMYEREKTDKDVRIVFWFDN